MSDLELFPTINANIEEIIEREKAVDGEAVLLSEPENSTQADMFASNVKMEVKDVKGNYSHLDEARKKGHTTRQKKAEAKRIIKAEAKAIKDEEKRLRRVATVERNRVKARERYRAQKAKKDEEEERMDIIRLKKQKEIQQEKQITNQRYPNKQPIVKQLEQGMNFEKFAGYMMKYEGMKRDYAESRRQKSRPVVPEPSEFPANYPLAHLYKKNKSRVDFKDF